jgi:hypothetical protein
MRAEACHAVFVWAAAVHASMFSKNIQPIGSRPLYGVWLRLFLRVQEDKLTRNARIAARRRIEIRGRIVCSGAVQAKGG